MTNELRTKRLASMSEAAEYASVCTKTIHRWIAAGHLPGYRLGPRLVKVDLSDVDALLKPIPVKSDGSSR